MLNLLIFSLASLISLLHPSPSLAQNTKSWNDPKFAGRCVKTVTIDGSTYNDIATIQGFECIFYNVLQTIVYIAGIAFFVMFIVGGFNYLFSGGDEKKAAAASSTLTMAVFGIVGVIASYFILRLIQNFTGVNVLDFVIPGP